MTSTERDLSPCPFCGSRNVSLSAFDVQCDDCGALVVPKRGSDHEAGAIEAWNQRAGADALASIRAERDAAVAALKPFADAYRKHDDPGVSDLYDEQPISWHVPLGAYRRARTIAGEQKP